MFPSSLEDSLEDSGWNQATDNASPPPAAHLHPTPLSYLVAMLCKWDCREHDVGCSAERHTLTYHSTATLSFCVFCCQHGHIQATSSCWWQVGSTCRWIHHSSIHVSHLSVPEVGWGQACSKGLLHLRIQILSQMFEATATICTWM